MLASSSFDDILSITIFSVFASIGFASVDEGENKMSIGEMVGWNLVQAITGIICGILLGLCMKVFNCKKCQDMKEEKRLWIKFVLMLTFAFITPVICHIVHFHESKYIGIITYGYTSHSVWGHDKPEELLGKFWLLIQPFLFGTIGASVMFSSIDPGMLGNSIVIILCGLVFRWLGTFIVTAPCVKGNVFTVKERSFMAFALLPKDTVLASIGGAVLTKANAIDDSNPLKADFVTYG
jgi:NhaP-type Na+/H+ or K+/H+ antiporter